MSNRKKIWEQRHKSAAPAAAAPDPFLKEQLDYLKPDTVLDLASGSGRNTIFLSEHGFKVTAVDFSASALDQLRKSAARKTLVIETLQLDLHTKADISKLEIVDNIVVIHYKPPTDLLDLIPSLLTTDGILLYCTFNLKQFELRNFPRKYCLEPEELVNRPWDLKLLKYTSFKNPSGYYDAYLFRK